MGSKPLDLSSGQKFCPRCEVYKPLSEFHKSKSTGHGYQVYCKPCQYDRHSAWRIKNLDKAAEAGRKWRAANKDRSKDHDLKTHYGIAIGTYDALFEKQNGQCAICKTTEPGGKGRFHLDHCHTTNDIRGLLCHNCNLGIGYMKHSEVTIKAAIDYLKNYDPSTVANLWRKKRSYKKQ